jgi:hypothetical protein
MLYSDRYVTTFSDYYLTPDLQLRPKEGTKTINFTNLKELLLSKDFTRMAEYE